MQQWSLWGEWVGRVGGRCVKWVGEVDGWNGGCLR